MSRRVWVITGASSGLGLAMASYVIGQGDKVRTFLAHNIQVLHSAFLLQDIVTVRDPSKFPRLLEAAGAHPLYLDMSSSDDIIRKAAEDALAVHGYVDVLVNNAASISLGFGPLEELE